VSEQVRAPHPKIIILAVWLCPLVTADAVGCGHHQVHAPTVPEPALAVPNDGGPRDDGARVAESHDDDEGRRREAQRAAAEAHKEACDGGDLKGCTFLARDYMNADGVPRNTARAAELYEKACEGGEMNACFDLGVAYAEGSGVTKDEARATELLLKACNGGEDRGCGALGRWPNAVEEPSPPPFVLSARDKLQIARAACESTPIAIAFGFKCDCPSYTEDPDEGEHRAYYELRPIFPGHFSAALRDEALVATRGCASGAGSAQTYGAKVLVRRTPKGWTRVFYGHVALGACTSFQSPRGKTSLLCRRIRGHQGMYPVDFMAVAFEEVGGEIEERTDAFFGFTQYDLPYLRSRETEPLPIVKVERAAIQGRAAYAGGREGALSVALTVQSHVDCVGGSTGCPGIDTSPMRTQLRYVFDGSKFRLTPGSTRANQRLMERLKLDPQ
jgi:hypothetical protein